MLSSHSRLRFLLLVGLASCRQACGLTLAEDGSGGGGANAGGGGANAGGGGANAGGGGGAGVGANGTSNSTSSSNGGAGGIGPAICGGASNTLCSELDAQGSLMMAGCEGGVAGPPGGTCDFVTGQLVITPEVDTGFWDGGASTFVHLPNATQSGSFLAHTRVGVENLADPFSLAGLVVRDAACPDPDGGGGEADCNAWFKAEVGGFDDIGGYPNTLNRATGLRVALHNGPANGAPDNFQQPPLFGNVIDHSLPPGPYEVAICANKQGSSFDLQGMVRPVGDGWQPTASFDLLATDVDVGLVAATFSATEFTAHFDYFAIVPQAEGFICMDAVNALPLLNAP